MANKQFYQFLYSKQPKLTMVNGIITFGATGAVASATGPGIQSVTRLTTGIYKIKCMDNYVASIGMTSQMVSGPTGSAVTAGSFVTNTAYQITTLGTTTQAQWVAAGFDADYTASVGAVFVATAGGAGTGTATAIGASGISIIEPMSSYQQELKNLNTALGRGSSVTFTTYGATSSSVTTLIPSNPASGSQLSFKMWFRDSSVSPF